MSKSSLERLLVTMTLNHFRVLRRLLVRIRHIILSRFFGMDISPSVDLSLSAKLDTTFPAGIHIGPYTYIAYAAYILTHDRTRGLYRHTRIGQNCFIGSHSIILPGVQVGNNSIVGAGSVVTSDVPPRSMVAGNPAKIIRSGIEVGHYGRFLDADDQERALRATDPAVAALPDKFLGKN